ncbi:hypothetical protein ACFV9C_15265 [Kribbella sp. NPDC059898]|uniref:hypothetical protein n=1 Tax=Kribbella sp. NPDC059898 TaxID=3346995 RepID=UPI0036518324
MRKLIPAAAAVALAGSALMAAQPAQATTFPAACTVIHDGARWVYAGGQMVGVASYGDTFYADHEAAGNVYGAFSPSGGTLWQMQATDLSCP